MNEYFVAKRVKTGRKIIALTRLAAVYNMQASLMKNEFESAQGRQMTWLEFQSRLLDLFGNPHRSRKAAVAVLKVRRAPNESVHSYIKIWDSQWYKIAAKDLPAPGTVTSAFLANMGQTPIKDFLRFPDSRNPAEQWQSYPQLRDAARAIALAFETQQVEAAHGPTREQGIKRKPQGGSVQTSERKRPYPRDRGGNRGPGRGNGLGRNMRGRTGVQRTPKRVSFKDQDKPRTPATPTCYNCGEVGHISPQCTKPKKHHGPPPKGGRKHNAGKPKRSVN